MKKKNSIFTLLLLFAFVSFCYLSVSYVKTNVGSDEKQKDLNLNILMTPKSSGYDVTERWNYTSNYEVKSVVVSADGRYVAVGVNKMVPRGGDPYHSIFFFNTSDHDGIPLWSYDLNWPIDSLAISADGRYIAAISKLIDVAFLFNSTVPEPGEEKLPVWSVDWSDMGGEFYSVDISADGKYIVLGGHDGRGGLIRLYNNSYASEGLDKTWEFLWYYNPWFFVYSVAISADGKYVVAGTDYPLPPRDAEPYHAVFFLNTTDYILGDFQMPMWSFDAGVRIDSIAISKDGSYIAAGTSEAVGVGFLLNNTIPELGLDKEEVWSFDVSNWAISSVDISADGKYIAVGWDCSSEGDVGIVELYNNSSPSIGLDKAHEYLWHSYTQGPVSSVSISADGMYIAAGTYLDIDPTNNNNTVFLFENKGYTLGDRHDPYWMFNETFGDVNSVSMSAWGNYIAAGGDYWSDGRTYLFYHARPIPRILSGSGGDDDDDEESAIPFGNYYLVFAAIAVASLVIITKRKAIFRKQ